MKTYSDSKATLRNKNNIAYFVLFVLGLFLCSASAAQTFDSGSITVVPNAANSNYSPRSNETVTLGIPFAPCTLSGANRNDQFALLDDSGSEVTIFLKETLTWPAQAPCGLESTRALKIQFEFDATGGDVLYSWNLLGRNITSDEFESPITELQTDLAIKGNLMEPRVFAIHDENYLVQSRLVPPTSVASNNVYDLHYYPTKWEGYAKNFDFTNSTAANWLFDRTSTVYRQAIRRGEVEHYREAYLSHEFYVERIDDNGVPDDAGQPQSGGDDCVGGFAMGGKTNRRWCDGKYVYTEPVKLHLALTGDDSWQPDPNTYANTRNEMWKQMADMLVRGDNKIGGSAVSPPGFMEPYDAVDDNFTERHAGIGLATVLNSCELTLEDEVCGWVDQIIDNMYLHKTNNPDGFGDVGYLGHSWKKHENASRLWAGTLLAKNGTTIDIANTLGEASTLVAGDTVRINNQWIVNDFTLASDAVDLGGGAWRMTTTIPVVGNIGEKVYTDQINMRGDRAFSVWMSVQIADAVWQYYHWTSDVERKSKAAEILLGLAQAITKYGFWGGRINPSTEALIESAFSSSGETIEFYDDPELIFYGTGCGMEVAPYPFYASNNLVNVAGSDMNARWMKGYLNSSGDYSNQHLPDVLFILAMGIYFETDAAQKAAMQALANDSQEWFERWDCTASQGPLRSLAWQTKPDPFGTLDWVTNSEPGGVGNNNDVGVLSYSSMTFQENAANDGGTSSIVTIELSGDTFQHDGNFNDDEVVISGVPTGLTTSLTRVDDNTVTFKLTGNQVPHGAFNSISGISVRFTDNAFNALAAADVTNSTKAGFSISFKDANLSYNNATFFATGPNVEESATTLTATLSGGETFVVANGLMGSSHFAASNTPPNINVKVTGTSSTTARIELTGIATSHLADVSNLTLTFLDAAFNGASAASVIGSSKNDLSIDFSDVKITYDSDSFIENSDDDGSTNTILNLHLTSDTFANTAFGSPTHYLVSNIPEGLIAEVIRTGPNSATFALTGTAVNHNDSNDVSNIQLAFSNSAFTNGDASAVVNAVKSDIKVDFSGNTENGGNGNEGSGNGGNVTGGSGNGGNVTGGSGNGGNVTGGSGNGGSGNGGNVTGGSGNGGSGGKNRFQVLQGTQLQNDGTLTDVDNQGTIFGGTLDGEINNQGILSDVTLTPDTQVSGGVMQGDLMGSGSVSNTLLDLDSMDSDIAIGPGTQVSSKTVRNAPGLNLSGAILGESNIPNIDFPILSNNTSGDLSLAELTAQGLNDYFNNADSVIEVNSGGAVVLTNDNLVDLMISTQLSTIVTTYRPDGIALTSDGYLEIVSQGIGMKFKPTPLYSSSFASNVNLLEDGMVSIKHGDVTLFQRFGWFASPPKHNFLALSKEEAVIQLIGSSSDPLSQKVIVHYPDNSTQTLVPYLDRLLEFGAIVMQSEYEASFTIDPMTGIMQFFDTAKNLIFTAIPDIASRPAETGVTGEVLEDAGDLNGDGYSDFYYKTPQRTQLIYGLSP